MPLTLTKGQPSSGAVHADRPLGSDSPSAVTHTGQHQDCALCAALPLAKRNAVTWDDAPILKADPERGFAFGVFKLATLADGTEYQDSQGDLVSADELEKASAETIALQAIADEQHSRDVASRLVESFVMTPEKLTALAKADYLGPILKAAADSLPTDALLPCASFWMGSFQLADGEPLRKRVKDGSRACFSIRGRGVREAVA